MGLLPPALRPSPCGRQHDYAREYKKMLHSGKNEAFRRLELDQPTYRIRFTKISSRVHASCVKLLCRTRVEQNIYTSSLHRTQVEVAILPCVTLCEEERRGACYSTLTLQRKRNVLKCARLLRCPPPPLPPCPRRRHLPSQATRDTPASSPRRTGAPAC